MLLHALYTSPRNVEVELLVVAAMWEEGQLAMAPREEAAQVMAVWVEVAMIWALTATRAMSVALTEVAK